VSASHGVPDLADGRSDLRLDISAVLAEGSDERTGASEAREREQLQFFRTHICLLKACATIETTMGAVIAG